MNKYKIIIAALAGVAVVLCVLLLLKTHITTNNIDSSSTGNKTVNNSKNVGKNENSNEQETNKGLTFSNFTKLVSTFSIIFFFHFSF